MTGIAPISDPLATAGVRRHGLNVTLSTLGLWVADRPELPPVDWHVGHSLIATADLDDQRARELIALPVEYFVAYYARELGVDVVKTETARGTLLSAQGRAGDDEAPATWITIRISGTSGTRFHDWVADRR